MILREIGMIAVSSPRSKAYIQLLVKNKFLPSFAIIMENKDGFMEPGQQIVNSDDSKLRDENTSNTSFHDKYFDYDEPLTTTFKKAKIPFETCENTDINSGEVINLLKRRQESYFIYSGIGGVILGDEVLSIGKKYLHMHSGRVPQYRGSTTIFYSILNENQCSVSAFFLDKSIDTGPLLKIKDFKKPKNGRQIDYVYDSYIRAKLLLEIIQEYYKQGYFKILDHPNKKDSAGEYYIIHPVLKHIAILSCNTE